MTYLPISATLHHSVWTHIAPPGVWAKCGIMQRWCRHVQAECWRILKTPPSHSGDGQFVGGYAHEEKTVTSTWRSRSGEFLWQSTGGFWRLCAELHESVWSTGRVLAESGRVRKQPIFYKKCRREKTVNTSIWWLIPFPLAPIWQSPKFQIGANSLIGDGKKLLPIELTRFTCSTLAEFSESTLAIRKFQASASMGQANLVMLIGANWSFWYQKLRLVLKIMPLNVNSTKKRSWRQ